ncbi:11248_t:CDS:2, partial [Funneliformis geosporum]
ECQDYEDELIEVIKARLEIKGRIEREITELINDGRGLRKFTDPKTIEEVTNRIKSMERKAKDKEDHATQLIAEKIDSGFEEEEQFDEQIEEKVIEESKEPISELEKLAIIKFLDKLAFNSYYYPRLEKENPVSVRKVQKAIFIEDEMIKYAETIKEINLKEKVEKIRSQRVGDIYHFVQNIKGGSGKPEEAKKVLVEFANILKQEVKKEAGVEFTDLPTEKQDLLKIDFEADQNNSARKLAESKKKLLAPFKKQSSNKNNEEKD